MKLKSDDLISLSNIAFQAAAEAGLLIQKHFGKCLATKQKESGSTPASKTVTQIDLLSQEIILKKLKPSIERYDFGWLAEESADNGSRFQKDFFWCIDPLDGTLPFVETRSGYAVSISLVSSSGESQLGAIYDPFTQTHYHAIKGLGAFRNQIPWRLEREFSGPYKIIDSGGAVMNACWALEQAPACFYKKPKKEEGGGCLWDYAATVCLYQTLGAWVSDYQGAPLLLNPKGSLFMNHRGVLFATHPQIAEDILKN